MSKPKKALRPWSDLPSGTLPLPFCELPGWKEWIEQQKRDTLPPITIPKRCFDSQERAWKILVNKACGLKADESGQLDPDQYHLEMVAARGTAFGDGPLRYYLGGLVTVICKSKRGGERQFGVALSNDSIWESEARLNRFLKKLGRTLKNATKKPKQTSTLRGQSADWSQVDRIDLYLVQGWCERIVVDKKKWPPLCCLSYPAIVEFLALCKMQGFVERNKAIKESDAVATFRKRVNRLGLISIPRGKIRCVEKNRIGQFLFA